jgi:hypothetical protein
MRIKLKLMGLFGLVAVAALLAMAIGAFAAGASEFKTQSGMFPVSFLGEGLGLSTFLSSGLNSVTCQHSHSKGEVISSTLVKETITYLTGCEVGPTKLTCPTITTKELLVTPLDKLNGGTKLGLLVLPKSGTIIAEFECTGSSKVKVEVSGAVICEGTPGGKLVAQGKVICKAGATHGSQEFTSGTDPTGKTVGGSLTATSTLGIFKISEKDSQATTEDVAYSAAVEQTA